MTKRQNSGELENIIKKLKLEDFPSEIPILDREEDTTFYGRVHRSDCWCDRCIHKDLKKK